MLATHGRRLALLSVFVLAVHLWLAGEVMVPRLGEGAADRAPTRMEVAFVRELQQSAPAAAPAPAAPARRAAVPAPAASAAPVVIEAPLEPALEPLPPTEPAASVAVAEAPPEPIPPLPLPQAAAEPASAAAFEWPPSTRLSYTLTGNYRGPVQGQARVEWLRTGTRYQVFMDVSIGPPFAPLISRRSSSEGEITPEGLSPRRYDEETKALLREPRRQTIWLDADRVRLPGGGELSRPPNVQDSASQFVHLTWLFTTQPEWLTPGRSIEMPLALPRHVQPWIYDVLERETLHTPFGALDTVHVKPRRPVGKAGGDLAAEFWVAPSLQNLPVRIIIRQDADNYIDLLIERLPQQAPR